MWTTIANYDGRDVREQQSFRNAIGRERTMRASEVSEGSARFNTIISAMRASEDGQQKKAGCVLKAKEITSNAEAGRHQDSIVRLEKALADANELIAGDSGKASGQIRTTQPLLLKKGAKPADGT